MAPPCGTNAAMKERAPRPPLDAETLAETALGYAARYATTRAGLARYLGQKLRQRGWAGEDAPPIDALVEKAVALGAVDDRSFAEARTGGLSRRGYGPGRVRAALAAQGVARELSAEMAGGIDEFAVAEAYARRRRLGRFGPSGGGPDRARRDMGAMLRGGHGYVASRAALAGRSEDEE